MRKRAAAVALLLLGFAANAAWAGAALAASPPVDENAAIFAQGLTALKEERPGDAIADFEALGDRGLAYAQRVRGRSPLPGDLGRAALGFEEARSLTRDPALARDATKALGAIRQEVARRRALAGEPVDVDPGVPLGRAIVSLAAEDSWGGMAVAAAAILTASLFLRWLSRTRRVRIGAAIALGIAAPTMAAGVLLTLSARDERLHLHEGVIVTESARLSDEHHLTLAGASPLPEGARVTIEDAASGWARVKFGSQGGWVPSPAVRPITK